MDETKVKIRAFLARFFRKPELGDDDDFFALGLVNSLFAMQMVLFVEKEFKVKIENKDLDVNNFKSINAIARLVSRNTRLKAATVSNM